MEKDKYEHIDTFEEDFDFDRCKITSFVSLREIRMEVPVLCLQGKPE